MTEQRPDTCPSGHPFVAGHMIVGWEPCHCAPGHTGHRTYWCEWCGRLLEIPPCRRRAAGERRIMGPGGLRSTRSVEAAGDTPG